MADQAVERPEEIEKDGTSRRWLMEIEDASKREKSWRECATKAEEVYSDEKGKERFNILFSNVQTLQPALYNTTPRPDVRRRFRDKDPVGKVVSEILERALAYSVDSYDFDATINEVLLDYLVAGRGVARVRYNPTFGDETEGDGESYTPVVYEEAVCEHVEWDDFRILGNARKWVDVPAIAFRHRMTRKQLVEEFGETGSEVPLNYSEQTDTANERAPDDAHEVTKKAEVWEVWDKIKRRVIYVTQGFEKVIDTRDDPLGLEGFFPVPRPLLSIHKPRSLVPKPEYDIYKAQAEELNTVSKRLSRLTSAIRARGIYNPLLGDNLERLVMEDNDGILVPADKDAVQRLFANGPADFNKQVWFMPIDMLAAVMAQLVQQRELIKQAIYEITGISDILRGASDAQETASAQRIKAQFGSLRLNSRQGEVQRFIRDLFRLKSEIFAEQFDPQTLSMMTGIQLPTEAEKMQAQITIQNAQQAQALAEAFQTPEVQQGAQQYQQQAAQAQEVLKKPSWEQVMQMMQNDLLRGYRIDVETDSTIEADQAYDQRSLAELYKGIADFSGVMGPLVQQGILPMDAVKAMLLSAVRKFKMGRQVEDALEEIGTQPQNPGDEAAKIEAQKAQMELQIKQQEGQIKIQQMQARAQADQQKLQLEMQRMQAEAANDRAELEIKREELAIKQAELNVKRAEVQVKREEVE